MNWLPSHGWKIGVDGFLYISKQLFITFLMKIFSKVTPMQKNYIPEKVYFLVKLCEIQILKKKFRRYFLGEPLEIRKKNVVLFSSLFNFTISYNFAFSPKIAIFRKKMKKRPWGTRPRTSFGTNFGQIGLKYWSDPKM